MTSCSVHTTEDGSTSKVRSPSLSVNSTFVCGYFIHLGLVRLTGDWSSHSCVPSVFPVFPLIFNPLSSTFSSPSSHSFSLLLFPLLLFLLLLLILFLLLPSALSSSPFPSSSSLPYPPPFPRPSPPSSVSFLSIICGRFPYY